MSKKIKTNWFHKIKHMAITKKITLLYGGIFSVSLFVVSCFFGFNISTVRQQMVRLDMMRALGGIENYLIAGNISDDQLSALLKNTLVEAVVYHHNTDTFYYNNLENISDLLNIQKEENFSSIRRVLPEIYALAKQNVFGDILEIRSIKKTDDNAFEYIFYGDDRTQFMMLSKSMITEEGYFQIDILHPLSTDSTFISSTLFQLLLVNIAGIIAAFLIGRYISYRILKPVNALRCAAERITIEDLTQRICVEGPDDEMKELALTFNSMIDRLEGSFQRQNRFISDASHELRTPISVIQGYANLMDRWGKTDPDVLQESIDSIISETDHMSTLVRRLLLLAKSDQNTMPVQKRVLDVNALIEEVMKEFEMLHANRQITYDLKSQATIFADPDLMKQLFRIYLENAVKYTQENDSITMIVDTTATTAKITINDTGRGISEEDIPHIFDRFYRADKSRNKGISGTGLGLSIAKWILDVHEGNVVVHSVFGEGTEFINEFPLHEVDTVKIDIPEKNKQKIKQKDKNKNH